MSLKIKNTLTRQTETFQPLRNPTVLIYCCGVTVYDLCHLGHARSYIIWDILRRYLIWRGYKVTFVQNFTDIDDKILNRATEEDSSMETVSERNIEAFKVDMKTLKILPPDRMPRATKCLDGICSLISDLEVQGFAYTAKGDVYFNIRNNVNYGKLSGTDLSQLQEGASGRTNVLKESRKQDSFDFALWKAAKTNEPSFTSPWGLGRPGWHIECSAMVREELGETIDIHLGGADLIFPHHENEIAQSETATGQPLARYWLHNGMVNVNGQKMSKSLGNFITINDLLKTGISPLAVRLFVLQTHYRKPLDFSSDALNAASTGWTGLEAALLVGKRFRNILGWSINIKNPLNELLKDERIDTKHINSMTQSIKFSQSLRKTYQGFIDAMNDDLNTSAAIAILFNLARPLRSLAHRLERKEVNDCNVASFKDLQYQWQLLVGLASILGLIAQEPTSKDTNLSIKEIVEQVEARNEAKLVRDFFKADKIRSFLNSKGVELIDKPNNTTEWIQR
uniref:Cysteine--tRNA ligase n=1 Tax=Paulinella longichromatophora TaxID=1708747 RepID=A0A2H4ZNF6_9EUKA|nr:cysteinyl-tRNA synthetase [Paulinella longichromatophora]